MYPPPSPALNLSPISPVSQNEFINECLRKTPKTEEEKFFGKIIVGMELVCSGANFL